jgi:hypothetical protein
MWRSAHVAGGRATEGIFLAGADGPQAIALAGDDAPGVPLGVLVGFNAPALNDNDELAFVADVRRRRDVLDVLYFLEWAAAAAARGGGRPAAANRRHDG